MTSFRVPAGNPSPALPTSQTSTTGTSVNAQHAPSPMEKSEARFSAFQKSAKERLDEIVKGIRSDFEKIDFQNTPEFTEKKVEFISQYCSKSTDSCRDFLLNNLKRDAISSLQNARRKNLQQQFDKLVDRLHKIVQATPGDYSMDENWSAKIVLYAMCGAFFDGVEVEKLLQRIDKKEIDAALSRLGAERQNSKYLYHNPQYSIPVRTEYAIGPLANKVTSDFIKKISNENDLAAKVILWCAQNTYGSDTPEAKIRRTLRQWGGQPIKLSDDFSLLPSMSDQELQQLIESVEDRQSPMRAQLAELEKYCRIPEKFSDEVIKKAKDTARQIVSSMNASILRLEITPEMVTEKEQELFKEIDSEHPALPINDDLQKEAEAAFETKWSGKRNALSKVKSHYREKLITERLPQQLDSFTDLEKPAFNPKMITLRHPETDKEVGGLRGEANFKTVGTNQYGDIELSFPGPYNPGYFSNIEFIGKKGDEEHFKITEVPQPQRSLKEETFTLITGCKTNKGDPCVRIVCESGNETTVCYGQPMKSAVRKPLLAFRDFKAETSLTISVEFSGSYKVIYPLAEKRAEDHLVWRGTALPNNAFRLGEKTYPYLFWDGELSEQVDLSFDSAFCVAGKDTLPFLEEQAALAGLDQALITDFVTFWTPYLQNSPYNLIRFLSTQECEQVARLSIDAASSEAFQIIRFYMLFRPVHRPVALPLPESRRAVSFDGPKIIEWGGFRR